MRIAISEAECLHCDGEVGLEGIEGPWRPVGVTVIYAHGAKWQTKLLTLFKSPPPRDNIIEFR